MLPVIGLTFANHASCADPAALTEVLRTLVDTVGRVLDSMNVTTPAMEEFAATGANELGVQNKSSGRCGVLLPAHRSPASPS